MHLDEAFRVERGSVEAIPATERHGSARDLFSFWFTTTGNFGAIVAGGIAVSLGLNFWQSLISILIGAASYVILAAVSVYAPAHGLATMPLSRRVFGGQANWFNSLFSWLFSLGWAAVGLTIGSLSFAGIITYLDPAASGAIEKLIGLVVMGGLLAVASILGHATIQAVERWLGYVFAVFIVLTVVLLLTSHSVTAHLSLVHAGGALAGSGVFATVLIAVMIYISAGGLGWAYMGGEYTRYLPADTSRRSLFWNISLGGFFPSLVLPLIGVLLALAGKLTNPIDDIPALLPAWFGVPFLLFAVVSTVAGYVPNIYSAGIDLIVLGLKVKRYVSVLIVFAIALVAALYALFVYNFIGFFQTFLSLGVVWAAPWAAVFLAAYAIAYVDRSQVAFDRGAVIGGLAGMVVAFLFNNDYPLWVGPGANLLGGADISIYVGAGVALALFFLLRTRPSRS